VSAGDFCCGVSAAFWQQAEPALLAQQELAAGSQTPLARSRSLTVFHPCASVGGAAGFSA
jgi:hypothetical protein